MFNKQELLLKIKSLLEANKWKTIIIDKAIETKWASYKNKDYRIRELRISDDGKISAWQGYGYRYQSTVQYLEDFDDLTISHVAIELERTISLQKTYRVKVVSYVDVQATKPEYAKELISLHPTKVKEKLVGVGYGGSMEELE